MVRWDHQLEGHEFEQALVVGDGQTLATRGEDWALVKAMVFPVVMYGCESWTMKKAERQSPDPQNQDLWV